ncbi:MAG: hypothetical protein C4320_02120 [Armatimonadota bacterium]
MWTYDIAREQSPTYEILQEWSRLSLESGYTHLGLYLEHRFAYPSLPWLAGTGSVTPEMIVQIEQEFPDLTFVPFLNLLGHCEGLLYTEGGEKFAEEKFKGMQADPTNAQFVALCQSLVADALTCFRSPIIHLGGDETQQLGRGPRSQERVEELEADGAPDGKAVLYGEHFGQLCDRVLEGGRTPALWADMFKSHPDALDYIPASTILFDWQYFSGPKPPRTKHPKVYCPTIHTYNALWCHLPQSERNVMEHAIAAEKDAALGVCVTTWELGLLGNYNTLRAPIRASGAILRDLEADAPPSPNKRGPEAFDALVARSTYLDSLLEPYATPNEAGEFELHSPEDPAGPTTRLVLEQLIRSGEPRATFETSSTVARLCFDRESEDYGPELPAIMAKPTLGEILGLVSLPVKSLEERVAGQITGTVAGEPFTIEATLWEDGQGVQLEVVKSPFLREWHQTPIEREVALYAATTAAPRFLQAFLQESEPSEEWARLMGIELQEAGGRFAFSGWRSAIKCRLLLYSNPFLLYLRNGEDLFSMSGEAALATLQRALLMASGPDQRGPVQLGIKAVEFVRQCERAHVAYAAHESAEAINHLAPCRQIFEDLERVAIATEINAGGSRADAYRCRVAKAWVEEVIRRIKLYGDGSLGYVPSFSTITHPKFVPHDQANWWLINTWANE